MTQTIHCPSCQRMLRVPDSLLGQSVKCPSCEETFTAPDDGDAAPPPRPAPRPAPEEEDERPSRRLARRTDDDDDEDYRPVRRRRRREEDDEDEDDNYRRRGDDKPGKVQAIAIMTLIGGIMALVGALGGLALSTGMSLCWPGTYYAVVMGIMATIKGSQLLGSEAHKQASTSSIAIMQIINIINCDVINLTLGIITLVFLGDEEVKDFFRGR